MNPNPEQTLVEVDWRKFLHIKDAAHTTILCVAGSLWVTRDNFTNDFEILAGDIYVASGRQSITVCGFEPSVVHVFQRQPSPLRRHVARHSAVVSAMSFVTHAFARLASIKQGRSFT
jgi:hypothetical protein